MKPEPVVIGRVITPPYLPPPIGVACPRCAEDLLDHDPLGIVCRSGHAPECDCAAHDVGPACPALATIKPADPLPADVLEQLDPGVRRLVAVLRANGFETIDSGDGSRVEEKAECCGIEAICPYPHVVIRVEPNAMVREADRLFEFLMSQGIDASGVEDGSPWVEATYVPGIGASPVLQVFRVTDEMLP